MFLIHVPYMELCQWNVFVDMPLSHFHTNTKNRICIYWLASWLCVTSKLIYSMELIWVTHSHKRRVYICSSRQICFCGKFSQIRVLPFRRHSSFLIHSLSHTHTHTHTIINAYYLSISSNAYAHQKTMKKKQTKTREVKINFIALGDDVMLAYDSQFMMVSRWCSDAISNRIAGCVRTQLLENKNKRH